MTFPRLYTPGDSAASPPSAGDHLDDPYPTTLPFSAGPSLPPAPPLAARLVNELIALGHGREVAESAVDGLLKIVRGMLLG